MRLSKCFGTLVLILSFLCPLIPQQLQAFVPEVGPGKCVEYCGGGGSTSTPPPRPPTPEELERQKLEQSERLYKEARRKAKQSQDKGDWAQAERQLREALKLQEDADTYNNLGWMLSLRGKNDEATNAFQRALDLDPDNEYARNALAGQQLKSVEKHGRIAESLRNEAAKEESGKGFDTPGQNAGDTDIPVIRGTGLYREPLVPPEKRTPTIAKLEKERDKVKLQRQELEKNLRKLNFPIRAPQGDIDSLTKQIVEKKNEERSFNFSINKALLGSNP